MLDIIFAGDGHGAVVALKSLQKYFKRIFVVTNDKEVLSLIRDNSDKQILSFLDVDSEYVVCAGFKNLIKKDVLEKKTIINTHPSLLPKYRGLHSLAWAMLNEEKILGFTIHLMNEYIDDGDIIYQYKVEYNNETSKEIMDLFDEFVLNDLGKIVFDFINGNILPEKQNFKNATWCTKRNLKDCILDFNISNKKIDATFKTLVPPYPRPILKIKNKLYEILGYQLLELDYYMHVGRVINIKGDDVYIKVKDGILIVNDLIDISSGLELKSSNILKIGQRLI